MTNTAPFLPYGMQTIDDDDVRAVEAVLRSDFLTSGPAVEQFEAALSEHTQSSQAVSCSSGTAALHLAALDLKLQPGDRVIVPTITFLATANAARYVGAEVEFCDVDADTGLMRPADLERAIAHCDGKARAVFPVHLAGQAADMPGISEIARANKLRIVEDACHGLGSTYQDGNRELTVGSCVHSDMAAFSFHPVKTIAMGEGGAVTTNSIEQADNLKNLRSHGMTRRPEDFVKSEMAFGNEGAANPWYYEMPEMGFNYRASEIHCALGLSQLGKLEKFAETRRMLARQYDKALEPLAPLVRLLGRVPGGNPVWHLYVVLIDFAAVRKSRARVMNALREYGIGTQVHYIPVHSQPYYRQRYGDQKFNGAAAYYDRCLSLPLFPTMTDGDVGRVVAALKKILG